MNQNKKLLDDLIMEVLQEKFTLDQWDHIFGRNKPIGTVDSDKLTKFSDTNMKPKDVFDKLKNAGDNPNLLDITDIEYYKNNPDKIDPQIQSRLIAVSRAGARGDKEKYEAEVERLKAAGEAIAKEKGLNFPERPTRTLKKYATIREKYLMLVDKGVKQQLLAMAKEAELALAALNIAQTKAAEDEKTVSFPTIRTQAGTTGSFPKGQLAIVNRLLSSFNTIEARIKEITRISTKYYQASQSVASVNESESTTAMAELKKEFSAEPSKMLNEIMLLDIFNTLVKDTDSGSGAYTFEYFLALVTGGTVAGKMKTAAGKMGAADFVMGSQLGSAKFFKDDTGHNIKQAVSGFADLYSEKTKKPVKITYSIGLKKQGMTQIGKPALGSSDPNKIIAVEVFTPTVSYDGKRFTIDGKVAKTNKEGTSVLIPTAGLKSSGVMYICRTRTETFRQMLDDVMVKISDDAKLLFDAFKGYFDALRNANQDAKVYIANGKAEAGNKVYKSLFDAETKFSDVSAKISANKQSARTADKPRQMLDPNKTQRGLRENKKNKINSLKALDKLIEQVILYKNTEEK